MALQVEFASQFGFIAPEAYCVIRHCEYNKGATSYSQVDIYKDVEARNGGKHPIGGLTISYQWSPSEELNQVAKGYVCLRNIAGFENGTDV
jgi:hypothetical protein